MENVTLLRLDQVGGVAPGNKIFKLLPYIAQAEACGLTRLLSFGGVWSNHLHALAALGMEHGMETIALVRGSESECHTPMLEDARAWGMQVVPISRARYHRRNEAAFLDEVGHQYGPCVVIPEGGAAKAGASGCAGLSSQIMAHGMHYHKVVLSVGTGTTLAGLLAGWVAAPGSGTTPTEFVGVSALKGASDLESRVDGLLEELDMSCPPPWQLRHDFHCGGFARSNAALKEFITAFEAAQHVRLEPVYTGKMLWAVHQLLARGEWSSREPVLAIHTGGLQGRRGCPWLDAPAKPDNTP